MTQQQRLYSACIAGIISAGAIGVTYSGLQTIFLSNQGRTIIIIHDEQIAPILRKNLNDTLHDLLKNKTPTLTIFETIKKNTPALKNITVDYRKPGYITTRLTLDSPLCIIQQENQTPLVVSRAGYYAPYQQYNRDMIQGLPCIVVTEHNFSPRSQQALYQWLTELPIDFFVRYQIRWNNPTDITVLDQEHHNFEYRATCATHFTPAVEHDLAQLRSLQAQQKNKVKIDMRFKDQFILEPPLHKKKGVS